LKDRIFFRILSVPQDIVMGLNNVMKSQLQCLHLFLQAKSWWVMGGKYCGPLCWMCGLDN